MGPCHNKNNTLSQAQSAEAHDSSLGLELHPVSRANSDLKTSELPQIPGLSTTLADRFGRARGYQTLHFEGSPTRLLASRRLKTLRECKGRISQVGVAGKFGPAFVDLPLRTWRRLPAPSAQGSPVSSFLCASRALKGRARRRRRGYILAASLGLSLFVALRHIVLRRY